MAFTIAIEKLKDEQRISDWIDAHPSVSVWTADGANDNGEPRRLCTVVCDGKVIAAGKGSDDDDARGQAFSAIFLREARVSA